MNPYLPSYPPIPPPSPETTPPLPPSPLEAPRPTVARWRWWVALGVISLLPLFGIVASAGQKSENMLPHKPAMLLLYFAVELAIFGVMWLLFWAFSRANRADLFWRPMNGWKTVGLGLLYSVGLRLAVMVLAIFVLMILTIVLTAVGIDVKAMMQNFQKSQPDVSKVFAPLLKQGNAVQTIFLMGFLSFVLAGTREELWRVALMACCFHLSPVRWSQGQKIALALIFSSLIFGSAHLYQGWSGVVLTAILGSGLGAITLYHRSLWPSILAHGFFDATSFLMLAATLHFHK